MLTIEINKDTPITETTSRVLEERHSIRELIVSGMVVVEHVNKVACVDYGVAEAEDSLVAAAQTWSEVEQEDSRDEQGGQTLENPHLSKANTCTSLISIPSGVTCVHYV